MNKDIFQNIASIGKSKQQVPNDLGFGTKAYQNSRRLLNQDGTFNVEIKNAKTSLFSQAYHNLVMMSWTRFVLLVLSGYAITNLIFATIYYLIGVDALAGMQITNKSNQFLESFFFSTQTLTTVGFGRISPLSTAASLTAAIESMVGLLGFALATGLLYGRFSRPVADILYSTNGVIAPYRGIKGFMFRLANNRSNQLIETEVQVILSMLKEDGKTRMFETLNLERDYIVFMSLSWTVVHPIDETSPMYGLSEEEFNKRDPEFVVLFKAFDNTFSQTVYSRCSYKYYDILWNAKFKPMIGDVNKDGKIELFMDRMDDIEKVDVSIEM